MYGLCVSAVVVCDRVCVFALVMFALRKKFLFCFTFRNKDVLVNEHFVAHIIRWSVTDKLSAEFLGAEPTQSL